MSKYFIGLIHPFMNAITRYDVEFDGMIFDGDYTKLLKYVRDEDGEVVKSYASFFCKTKDICYIRLVE